MTCDSCSSYTARPAGLEGQAHGHSSTCRVRLTSTDWCSGAPASLMALSWLTAKPALSNSFLSISKLASCVLVLIILNFRACSSQVCSEYRLAGKCMTDEVTLKVCAVVQVACLQQPGSLALAWRDWSSKISVRWCDVMTRQHPLRAANRQDCPLQLNWLTFQRGRAGAMRSAGRSERESRQHSSAEVA